jgi:tetratricopeptide (TPR) repeat protein
LTAGNDVQPAQLVYYIQGLFRHKDLPEAQRQTDRLVQLEKSRKVEPGAFGSAEFRALLLLARKQGDKGLTILEDYAKANDNRPERKLQVAGFLARLERVDEALQWCERARPASNPELFAAACVSAVRVGKGGPGPCAKVEAWLKQAIDADPKSPSLLIYLADLKDVQGQFQEQEALYRRLLERDPNHALALNNLAWLLAHRPGGATEALTLINRAIATAGPRTELLDTRAYVLVEMGQPDQSIRDLQAVTAETSAPASYLRLAWAHQRAGNRPAAQAALKQARGKGLEVTQLHPLDRKAFQKVVEELEQ